MKVHLSLAFALGFSIFFDVESAAAENLRIASWNMEHLADTDGEGCRPRRESDYIALRVHADRVGADVIAVQEVENELALARVFDPGEWSFEVARNADQTVVRPCGGTSAQTIITQRAGFVIRKGLRYTRNPDFLALDIGSANRHRYGVDITLEAGSPFRLLAVHLKSGCASGPLSDAIENCRILLEQQKQLGLWVTERSKDGVPFALLGDFNRQLQSNDEFWMNLDKPGHESEDLSLSVPNEQKAQCNIAFPRFIDFIVLNQPSLGFLDENSFKEVVYPGAQASDHCPISVNLTIPDMIDQQTTKGQMTTGLRWFRNSAEFALISRFIYDQGIRRVEEISDDHAYESDWVVSLDADETILDNSLGQLENEYLGLGYSKERFKRWEGRAAAKEIPGAVDFMNHVLSKGGKIVVITNREAEYEAATRANLARLGLISERQKVCVLGRSDADMNQIEWEQFGYKNDKDRRRRLVREGNAVSCWANDPDGSVKASWNRPHQIVFWVGDNVLDLPMTTQEEARARGTPGMVFGEDYLLLPNPLYGSW